MNNKKRIVLIILILFIVLFSGYILIKNNGNDSIDKGNISNNTSSNTINNSSNISDNLTDIKDNLSDINDSSANQDLDSMNQYNHQDSKKSKAESKEITADDILERVKKGVWWDDGHGGDTQDVRLGKPYKFNKDIWLVAAFDKKTGKFLGSVWVASEGGYSHGPDSYSEYKNIISGKNSHKSDSNKNNGGNTSNYVVGGKPDSSDFYVLTASNPNMSSNPNIIITNRADVNLDNSVFLDSNQQMPIIESDNEINSTC